MVKKVYVVPECEVVYVRMEMNIMSDGDTPQGEGSEFGGNVFP